MPSADELFDYSTGTVSALCEDGAYTGFEVCACRALPLGRADGAGIERAKKTLMPTAPAARDAAPFGMLA